MQRPWFLLVLAGILLLGYAGFAAWRWTAAPPPPPAPVEPEQAEGPKGPPPDPRSTYATPYRNVRPEVRYVGSAACAGCHREITESFRHHPMGRASVSGTELAGEALGFWPSGQEPLPGTPVLAWWLARLERYNAGVHDPFLAQGIEHRVEVRGGQVLHRETRRDAAGHVIATLEAPVCLAIGSGTRGRTYAMARGDSLVQSSISWFSQKDRWDLSPGYDHGHTHFERPVTAACLYCHTNAVEPVDGTLNRYRPPLVRGHAIGCERCHGPGELHVASRKRDETFEGPDLTIVNPADLEPALRESVCEQCHLQGLQSIERAGRKLFDYRPGLPYHLFWSVFVLPEELSDRHKSVTTVEQMHASACYRKSMGALGCISCHDPHELPAPEDRAAFYRGRCLQCHADNMDRKISTPPGAHRRRPLPQAAACSEAEAVRRRKQDDCIACHMPRLSSSDIAHTANTDHRVPRRPDPPGTPSEPPRTLRPGQLPLVHFHHNLVPAGDTSTGRDLGIALVRQAMTDHENEWARQALPLLQAAVRDWPDDLAAQEALANALGVLGRTREAVATTEALLARAPDQEGFLLRAAQVAERMDWDQKAVDYYQRALKLNSHRAAPHFGLARVLAARREWERATEELEAGLRLDPFDLAARKLLVYCYLKRGVPQRAREEFGRVLGFDPPDRGALTTWFEEQLHVAQEIRKN